MKKKDVPMLIIIASFILIVLNIFTTTIFSLGFLLRIFSSVLLILAMYLTIKERKKRKSEQD